MQRWSNIIIGAVAIAASACAQTSDVASRAAYVPRGQAAQPSSWIAAGNDAPSVVGTHHVPRGQAAQPGSWNSSGEQPVEIASSGRPAGQAAQPGWFEHQEHTASALAKAGAARAQ